MGILKTLKSFFIPKPREPDMKHTYFGDLMYDGIGNDKDIWEGEISLAPISDSIGIHITAGESGPTDNHVTFIETLKSNIEQVIEDITPKLKPSFEQWTDKSYPKEFFDEFKLVHITIPLNADLSNPWSISFDCKSDIEHMFTVEYENGFPIGVSIDG
jgi:hypothetical protein